MSRSSTGGSRTRTAAPARAADGDAAAAAAASRTPPPACRQAYAEAGRRQSTGAAPCRSSSSFAREKGREPKKPRLADSGDGCADSMIGVSPSSGRRFAASLSPAGSRRARRRERRACGSRARSPSPSPSRGGMPAAPGATVEHPVEQHHALVAPGGQVAVRGTRDAEIGLELLIDVREAARQRSHVRVDREREADRDGPASGRDPARR